MTAKHKLLLILGVAISTTKFADAQKSCGFKGIPENTKDDPIVLPPISDNLPDDGSITLWRIDLFGSVNRTGVVTSHPHSAYLTGLSAGSSYYRLRPNARSKLFTRDFSTRTMTRTVYVFCNSEGGEVEVQYHLEIPFKDMSPPEFLQPRYTFNIPSNWDIANPVSAGHFVIVTDNAYEIGDTSNSNGWLSYDFIGLEESAQIDIEFIKLWTLPNPEYFSYRLDFYLKNALPAGTSLQFGVSVKDQFNSGSTIIELNVSE